MADWTNVSPFFFLSPHQSEDDRGKRALGNCIPSKEEEKGKAFPRQLCRIDGEKERKRNRSPTKIPFAQVQLPLFPFSFLCLPSPVVKKGPSCSAVVVWLSIPPPPALPLLCSDAISPSPPPRIIRGVRKRGKNGGSGERGETFIVMIRRLLPLARDSAL